MRLDDIAPRTLLLGVFAGWAVLAWVLALAGMGRELPDGESGTIEGSRLPELPEQAPPTLGPFAQYDQIVARPLFATDRRPHAFLLPNVDGQAEAAPSFDLVLTSVLITTQVRIAIVQKPDGSESWRVKLGEAPDALPSWTLVDLAPRSAVFQGPEGRKELALRVFDGKGGEPPSASAAPPPGMPGAPPSGATARPAPMPSTPTPPMADAASMPDPQQIDQIRQRIEARREEMRRRAQNANPPATVAPPAPATR